MKNKVILVTGGSKGLGLVLARQLIKEKCQIALCARDERQLKDAKTYLENLGGDVFVSSCDVSNEVEVIHLIREVIQHFGKLDILINCAGVIQVAPMETFHLQDYKKSMDIMYWGIANTTFAVIPHMKERKVGQIVNITSIGGIVPVPHLLPYTTAKFAAVGFSEGCGIELLKDNITVTTIVPWLMRTGSYVNAFFQRGNKKEFKLFSFMANTPLLTLSAEKAASRIIKTMKKKKSFKVIGFQARLVMELHHFFPNLTIKLFGIASRIIPSVKGSSSLEQGIDITQREKNAEVPGVRQLGKKARDENQDLRSL